MKKIFSLLVFFFCALALIAQTGQNNSIDQIIKTPPNPPRLVNDYANVLTPEQRDALERKLYQFDDTTSNQLVVVIVSSLDGKDVADAAIELGRNWKVGDKKNNNGVVTYFKRRPQTKYITWLRPRKVSARFSLPANYSNHHCT